MAVKTRAELKAENSADFPNNQTRLISPADLRGQMDDIVDSMFLAEDIDQPGGPVGWPLPIDGDGEDLHGIDGVAVLRETGVTAGQTLRLNYHTTPGDLGSGLFRGVSGAAAGTYVDNEGTIIVPSGGDGSAAWLRVWDGITAHVGWWGAKCDHTTDDYGAAYNALSLFTNGRTVTRSGVLDVGPGFVFNTPLVIGGNSSFAFRLCGQIGTARGINVGSYLTYAGPATHAAIVFYGANESGLDNINVVPGLAYNGVLLTADNPIAGRTLSAPVTAGTDVIATLSSATSINVGSFLGIGDGGSGFEVVYVSAVSGSTITAAFRNDHVAGEQVGGSSVSSGMKFHRCALRCPAGPVYSTLSSPTVAATPTTFTPASMTGIQVGMPLRIDSHTSSEIVSVTSVGGSTFEADSTLAHSAGALVIYPTAAVLMGNRLSGTSQVSEVIFDEIYFTGTSPVTSQYAGFRQILSGNVKNVTFGKVKYNYLKVAFAFEAGSGEQLINGAIGGCEDTVIVHNGGGLTVLGLEDESTNCYLLRGSSGSNPLWATFIGAVVQGGRPANNQIVAYTGALTMIGCELRDNRNPGVSFPVLLMPSIRATLNPTSSLTMINTMIQTATASSAIVIDSSGFDIIALGDGRLTMLNCTGGGGGSATVALPSILPPLTRWQNTATYDPPSLAASTADTAQTMTVTGAALGDLVEASFSLNLGEMLLRAWVSAVNTVSYQFRNPTAAPIDLGSGTVKCRVKK